MRIISFWPFIIDRVRARLTTINGCTEVKSRNGNILTSMCVSSYFLETNKTEGIFSCYD